MIHIYDKCQIFVSKMLVRMLAINEDDTESLLPALSIQEAK